MSGYKLPVAAVIQGKWFGSADCSACGGTGLGETWKDEHTLADCAACGGIGMVAYDINPAMWQGKSRWPFRLEPVNWRKFGREMFEEATSPLVCAVVVLLFWMFVGILSATTLVISCVGVATYSVICIALFDRRLKK